jgi:rhodanese-related sulfurtransferase
MEKATGTTVEGEAMSGQGGKDLAGEISPEEAYAILGEDARAVLVDVRTEPEWQFVGGPDLTSLGKSVVFLQWQIYPAMGVDEGFVATLEGELRRRALDESAPVLFMCRSGARSRQAAIAMAGAGWSRCYNVAEGFEGVLDADRHRGKMSGWRARGLPWVQT